jgi:hypothetical protein
MKLDACVERCLDKRMWTRWRVTCNTLEGIKKYETRKGMQAGQGRRGRRGSDSFSRPCARYW